ncbi:hypothetical protein RhiirA1_454362 [Rhizophagus irregularis]|uniref:Uncharacterized protein n=1 Tax=Rhizophagus irregularis TaxID=588596 RepID=A0A2I1FCY4_9GLOM|nr:hypothetical protein RhiirA1_454362 [Rhizophagus irregularis]PKY32252.1 hypothetical protein RhiirB3_450304 [Rhizophagus irregularis]CAB4493077.1 unnamed protein product [Rhizophagus irregularis]
MENMNSTQNYSNIQTPLQIVENNGELNFQHTSTLGMSTNTNINTSQTSATASAPTFEFYLPIPNDTRIYHVTYTELNTTTEIAQHLNNRINLSHVPYHHFQHHYNVQTSIRQQIVQQSADHPQNMIQLYSNDSNDNTYNASSISGDNVNNI